MFAVIETLGTIGSNVTNETNETNETNGTKIIIKEDSTNLKNQPRLNKTFVGLVDSIKDCYKFCDNIIGSDTYSIISDKNIENITNDNSIRNGKYLIEDNIDNNK